MIKKGKKILLIGKKKFLVKAEKRKFSTQFGEIDLGKLIGKKFGTTIKSHLGEEFTVVEPSVPDILRRIKRGPQIVTLKDAGLIASLTGLNKKSKVVEAGSGSGHLSIFIGKIADKLYTYENREEFYKIAEKNIKENNLKNVKIKNEDIGKCSEKDVDIFILDLGSPEKYIETAKKCLKPGGYLVIYSPVVEQAQRLDLDDFKEVETIECILREWSIGNNKTRPKTKPIGHTAFLTFGRKA